MPVLGAAARRGARARASSSLDGGRWAARRRDGAALLRPRVPGARPGTEALAAAGARCGAALPALSTGARAASRLNYRRFFDVDHPGRGAGRGPRRLRRTPTRLLLELVRERADRRLPDRPPRRAGRPAAATSRRLADATGDAWVVVEKILEGDEQLPDDWRVRGHDRLRRAAAGAAGVRRPRRRAAADRPAGRAASASRRTLDDVVHRGQGSRSSREVQAAEVNRLMRLRRADRCPTSDHGRAAPRRSGALLVAMDRYRAYLVPGRARRPRAGSQVLDATPRRGLASPGRRRGPRRRRRRGACWPRARLPRRRVDERPGRAPTSSWCGSSRPAAR